MLKSLGGLAIAGAEVVYWGSPLFVVGEFTHAIATGDAEAVNGLIDFPALRSSLKALAGLASGVVEPFVNALVDSVATPPWV